MMKRNVGMHTDADKAKVNILRHLATYPSTGFLKSNLGRVAFPDYDFKRPQGAAFAVAKIVRELDDKGFVRLSEHHWYITRKGLDFINGVQPGQSPKH